MPDRPGDSMLIDLADLCGTLRLGRTAVLDAIKSGRIPLRRQRLCRKMLFSREELTAWVAAGMPPSSRWSLIREQSAMRAVG